MGLSARIKSLTPEQRGALLKKLKAKSVREDMQPDASLPKIEPMGDQKYQSFPLTDIQQAYWVGRRSGFSLGNISAHGYMEVDGCDIDLAQLEQAFNQVIQRHDMLRAVITADGRQRILTDTPEYRFQRYALEQSSETERTDQLNAVREEMSHQVLDAETWPLFDIRVSQLPEGVMRLHLSIDVLIFDAQSFDIISEQWQAFYQGNSNQLKPLDLSYADYVDGLQQLQQFPLYEKSRQYWRRKIEDLPSGPEFPLAISPDSIDKPQFNRRGARLSQADWRLLKSNAKALGITPSVALLTAYACVINRWSLNDKFSLNLTLFNRLPFHSQVNELVGDFTSVVLLAVDMREPGSFAEKARVLQEQLWQDMDHRFVSGVWVMRELTERRRNSGAAQMPVVFTSALQNNNHGEDAAAMSWLGDVTYTITQTPQVWLDHQVGEDKGELVFDWDAVDALFEPGFLDAMFETYRQLLTDLATRPETWEQTEFDLLPAAQQALLHNVNETSAPVPQGLLHTPVLTQCQQNPSAVAVIDSGQSFSYGDIYLHSNFLAHRLWQQGSVSGDLVAVLLPKGYEQIVAVLAVLEAGGAYVPIESSYSAQRVAQLLALAKIKRVITSKAVLAQCVLPEGIQSILVDDSLPENYGVVPLPPMCRPADLAYIIYTSGSTGTPKGVMIDHRGALNTVVDINRRFSITASDRVLALSALNFDLSVYDIFGLLAEGAAIVFPDQQRQREPAHWHQLISAHDVSVWNTVPALMDIYVSYLRDVLKQQQPSLRLVMMSGDWIPLALPDAISQWCPKAQAISLGGATEASIWSILYPIETVGEQWLSIPYGKPMLNQTFHVFDQQLQTCPVWVAGELFIGGIGVAQGYWQDEERTGNSFIVHPRTGERLYRTGDLGRYLPDGNIEFLGRKDFQVKINGYRVELGEIEATMLAFPGIQSAVVAVSGEQGQSKSLAAYYVKKDGVDSDNDSIVHNRKTISHTAVNAEEHENNTAAVAQSREEAEKLLYRFSFPAVRRFNDDHSRIPLTPPEGFTQSLLQNRRSQRTFATAPVSLIAMTDLLSHLRQEQFNGFPKYRYASGGGLYPVQTYVYIKENRVEGIAAGLYYYHPIDSELVLLTPGEVLSETLYPQTNHTVARDAAFIVFLVADMDTVEPEYKSASSTLCLLEAGLIAQMLDQAAPSLGLGMCQLGGFYFKKAESLFQLERKSLYLHSLAGGIPDNAINVINNDEPCSAEQTAQQINVPRSRAEFEKQLFQTLREKLPEYMVPAHLIPMDTLPLSANGKVDRKALAKPEKVTPMTEASATTRKANLPDNELAKTICQIWGEVLDKDNIGVDDSLLDLGGTSVDMIKIHTRLQPQLPQEISLLDMFFTYPTVAALVEYLQPAQSQSATGKREAGRRREKLKSQKNKRSDSRRGRH